MAALIYSPSYRLYDFGAHHPLSTVGQELALELLAACGHRAAFAEPEPATREDLLTVHGEDYVRAVEALSAGEPVPHPEAWGLGTADTPVFPGMDPAARLPVGGTLAAARLLREGKAERALNFGGGFHHARASRASGFCVYSDVGVALRHLANRGWWVSYLDLDVHHCDGVQSIFYADDRVQTISLHESGLHLFPGTGGIHELGEGMGRGLAINVPLEPFTDGESYLEVFELTVPRALEAFGPRALVVQAGADAHFDDPLADLCLTTRTYETLFRRVLDLASSLTAGRVLFTLGGGYSPLAAARVWAILYLVLNDLPVPETIPGGPFEVRAGEWAVPEGNPVASLHDPAPAPPPPPRREEIALRNRQVASRLLDALVPYWY